MISVTTETQSLSIRETIISQIQLIAQQQSKKLAPLADDLPLAASGLDSLCIAVLVASLDDQLGLDPFALDEGTDFPVTIGDFIRLYENAAA